MYIINVIECEKGSKVIYRIMISIRDGFNLSISMNRHTIILYNL